VAGARGEFGDLGLHAARRRLWYLLSEAGEMKLARAMAKMLGIIFHPARVGPPNDQQLVENIYRPMIRRLR
jgi:hypothetical protein